MSDTTFSTVYSKMEALFNLMEHKSHVVGYSAFCSIINSAEVNTLGDATLLDFICLWTSGQLLIVNVENNHCMPFPDSYTDGAIIV